MIIRNLLEISADGIEMPGMSGVAAQGILMEHPLLPGFLVRMFTLEPSGHKCGAIYTGKVIGSLKGESDTISFGHFHGYEIGSKYLLFLTKPDREYRPLASTNSMAIAREQDYREKCNDVLTAAKVMHSGYGAIEITWAITNNYEDAAKVATRFVVLPESMQTELYIHSEREQFDEYVWVPEQDLIDYLKQIE